MTDVLATIATDLALSAALMLWLERRVSRVEERLAVWSSRESARRSDRPGERGDEDTQQILTRYREVKKRNGAL